MRSRWDYKLSKDYLAYLRSKKWRQKREQVIQRCTNTCERCGKFPVAEVHHLTYVRLFQEELDDLQGLCEYCHPYVHGKRHNDGVGEWNERQLEREFLRQLVDRAESELKRVKDRPQDYLPSAGSPFTSPREIMAKLRQYPLLLRVTECQIFDVRYAKRKHESAAAFKVKWQTQNGFAWQRIFSAEALLFRGLLVLDTERQMWIDIEFLQSFVKRYKNFE